MDLDELKRRRDNLVKQRDQYFAAWQQTIGAITVLDELIGEVSGKPEKESEGGSHEESQG